jgi:hypothetical protein
LVRQILVVHHPTLRVAQTPSLHANPTGDRAQPIDWLALLDISPAHGCTCRAGLSAQLCNTLDKKNTYVGATTCVSGYVPGLYLGSLCARAHWGRVSAPTGHPQQRGATQYGIASTVADGPVPPRAEMRAWHELIRRTATCRERHCAIHSIHHAAQHRSDAPTDGGRGGASAAPTQCLFG